MRLSINPRSSLFTIFLAVAIFMTLAPSARAGSDVPTNSATSSKAPVGETITGKATYYPNRLNGHKTSNGERFHQSGNTAASNKLPLGTHVKVTNLENGRSTDVKVTDRGPALGKHKIDLSKKAASEIGLTHKEGKVPVKIKVTQTSDGPEVQ
jgi:rare lipoprotein A (peptidoglycan hydrolase)